MNGCSHTWTLYTPPKRWWQRRVWRLYCTRCGGSAGAWHTKAEALQQMANLTDDWKN